MSKNRNLPVALILAILVALGALAYFGISRLKRRNELLAIGTLHTIYTVQAMYRDSQHAGPAATYSASLADMHGLLALMPALASGATQGYTFRIVSASAQAWSAVAEPEWPGLSGSAAFFVDETGIVRYSWDGPASATSPVVGL